MKKREWKSPCFTESLETTWILNNSLMDIRGSNQGKEKKKKKTFVIWNYLDCKYIIYFPTQVIFSTFKTLKFCEGLFLIQI